MTSAATRERLRKLRQKHHLGEYRTSKTKSSRKKHSKRVKHYSMAKHHRRRSSGGFGGLQVKNLLLGGAAGLFVGKVIPQADNLVGRAFSGWLLGKTQGAIAAVAAPMVLGGVSNLADVKVYG